MKRVFGLVLVSVFFFISTASAETTGSQNLSPWTDMQTEYADTSWVTTNSMLSDDLTIWYSYERKKRARKGRNPQTGEVIK